MAKNLQTNNNECNGTDGRGKTSQTQSGIFENREKEVTLESLHSEDLFSLDKVDTSRAALTRMGRSVEPRHRLLETMSLTILVTPVKLGKMKFD